MDESEDKVEYWKYVIEEQQESGLNKTEFCRKNDISAKTFFKWQRYFRENSVPKGHALTTQGECFIEVEDPISEQSGLTVALRSDLVLQLSTNFEEQALKRFLKVAYSL